jgi:hypothetical protein
MIYDCGLTTVQILVNYGIFLSIFRNALTFKLNPFTNTDL